MSQPPYGVPPQGAQPHPPQPPAYGAPPPYLGTPVPGGQPFGGQPFGGQPSGAAYGAPAGFGLQGLAPASKPRTVGLLVGLLTTFVLLVWLVVVAVITSTN